MRLLRLASHVRGGAATGATVRRGAHGRRGLRREGARATSGATHGTLAGSRVWGSPRAGGVEARRRDFGLGLTQPDRRDTVARVAPVLITRAGDGRGPCAAVGAHARQRAPRRRAVAEGRRRRVTRNIEMCHEGCVSRRWAAARSVATRRSAWPARWGGRRRTLVAQAPSWSKNPGRRHGATRAHPLGPPPPGRGALPPSRLDGGAPLPWCAPWTGAARRSARDHRRARPNLSHLPRQVSAR
jgi:hypothetical protein